MWKALTAASIAPRCPALAGAQTITFTPTAGVPTFAVREPVLRIKPGTTVETKTFSRPGDYYEGGAVAGRGRAVPHRGRGARRHARRQDRRS